jgi:hypothetical protein
MNNAAIRCKCNSPHKVGPKSGRIEFVSVSSPRDAELEAAQRELQELYRRLAIPRPFSWSRMTTQRRIARVKRRIAALESDQGDGAG